jgi:hypothetical protein
MNPDEALTILRAHETDLRALGSDGPPIVCDLVHGQARDAHRARQLILRPPIGR